MPTMDWNSIVAGAAILVGPAPSVSPAVASVGSSSSIDWPAWLTAIGTGGAVVVALVLAIWGEKVRSFWFRPKLDITIEPRPPDCIKIQTRVTSPRTGEFIEMSNAYYCRLQVWNHGNVPARDVEVTLLRLHRKEGTRTV